MDIRSLWPDSGKSSYIATAHKWNTMTLHPCGMLQAIQIAIYISTIVIKDRAEVTMHAHNSLRYSIQNFL